MIRTMFFIGFLFIMIGIVKKENKSCKDGIKIVSLPYEDFKKADILNNIN